MADVCKRIDAKCLVVLCIFRWCWCCLGFGQMGTFGLVTIFIGNEIDCVGLTIRSYPTVGTTHGNGLILCSSILQFSFLLPWNSIAGLKTVGKTNCLRFQGRKNIINCNQFLRISVSINANIVRFVTQNLCIAGIIDGLWSSQSKCNNNSQNDNLPARIFSVPRQKIKKKKNKIEKLQINWRSIDLIFDCFVFFSLPKNPHSLFFLLVLSEKLNGHTNHSFCAILIFNLMHDCEETTVILQQSLKLNNFSAHCSFSTPHLPLRKNFETLNPKNRNTFILTYGLHVLSSQYDKWYPKKR